MSQESHKKSITVETPVERFSDSLPNLSKSEFDVAISHQGTDVTIEEAMRCPCVTKSTRNALSNCKNCKGKGWIFIDKKSTRGVVQNLNRRKGYINWSEKDAGTISVTLRGRDRIAFMDRVFLMEYRSRFSEVIYLEKNTDGDYEGYSVYFPLTIEKMFLYVSVDAKLTKLSEADYTMEDNFIKVLAASVPDDGLKEYSISVRYVFNPQYFVIDITREQSLRRGGEGANCDINDPSVYKMADFPVNVIARLAHYVLDQPDSGGLSVFDNSAIIP